MRISGLNYTKLNVAPKPDSHTFHCVSWKPDIIFLTQDQIMCLTPENSSIELHTVVDLIAYKKLRLKVLKVNLDDTDTSFIWFHANALLIRAMYSQ